MLQLEEECCNSIIVKICYIFIFWVSLHFPYLVTIVSCIYICKFLLVNAMRYSNSLSDLSVLQLAYVII